MWVVKKVGFVTSSGQIHDTTFQFMSSHVLHGVNTTVHLSNTETGDFEVLYSKTPLTYLDRLKHLNPYGFVDKNAGHDAIIEDNVLVVVDDLSLQFLKYVSCVKEMRVYRAFHEHEFVSCLKGSFTALDAEFTLFDCNTVVRCACTLFHAMCYCPNGWLGDDFWLYSHQKLDCDGLAMDYVDIAYKVEFSDVVAAKRLLTKAVVSGINPVSEYAKADFF